MKVSTLAAILTIALIAPAVKAEDWTDGFGLELGYRGLKMKGATFSHATHPNDFFLPGASTPGSAGTTTLDHGIANYGALGVRYQGAIIPQTLNYNVSFGGLAGGLRDRHKNANDSRPDAIGAFIYSEGHYGLYADAGLSYQINRLSIGVNAEIAGIYLSNGWDRYGSDQEEQGRFKMFPSIGPKIGYRFSKHVLAEASVQFGKSTMASFTLVLFPF